MQKNGATNQIFCFAFTSISFVADTHIYRVSMCGDNFFIIIYFLEKKNLMLCPMYLHSFLFIAFGVQTFEEFHEQTFARKKKLFELENSFRINILTREMNQKYSNNC